MAEELAGSGELEIKRRRRFTDEFKRQVVAETLSGEDSVAGVALRHRLNNNLVFTWRRKYLRVVSGASAMPAKMLPVTIAEPEEKGAAPVARTKVETKRAARARSSGTIEIAWDGVRIVVRGAVDAQALQVVLAALTHE
jgi:transposase